jgi:hypothetical protein
MSFWAAESEVHMVGFTTLRGRAVAAITICLIGSAAALTAAWRQDFKAEEPTVKVFRLVSVEPGQSSRPIPLGLGDMLQLAPFQVPVNQQTLGAKLKVELKGDRALEVIGQTVVALPGEGASRNCVFLYARGQGKVTATVTLVDAKGQLVEDEAVRYEVRITAVGQGVPVQTGTPGTSE